MPNRMEIAIAYHEKGYNCCQSVLASFGDKYDISEETALRLAAGFGGVMLACIVADWLIVMGCNPKRWRCRK